MLEVEAKYRLLNAADLERRLNQFGATLVAEHVESDHYLGAPDRNFARTDEALRLRCVGDMNTLTYKGPRKDSYTKTRTEHEVTCPVGRDSAQSILTLFDHLGYRRVATVKKRRRMFGLSRGDFSVHVCLDDVEKVGAFVELEIVADDSQYAAAVAELTKLANELELGPTETRSYLEQLLGETVPIGGQSS